MDLFSSSRSVEGFHGVDGARVDGEPYYYHPHAEGEEEYLMAFDAEDNNDDEDLATLEPEPIPPRKSASPPLPLRRTGPSLSLNKGNAGTSSADNYSSFVNVANADRLATNVPLKPRVQVSHVPVLSNRGAGLRWNQQTPRAAKPREEERFRLINGNYTVDCPIPSRLLRQVPHSTTQRDEFTHMRYTAVTCDPESFSEELYTLRPKLFGSPRSTEIMIVLTMYNEDDILFARTLRGVLANISYLVSREKGFWRKSAWKNIVVCLVSDGRAKLNLRTRALLTLLGVYQDGVARQSVEGKDVKAHLYEYTTQLRVQIKNDAVKTTVAGSVPCQILFCLKERNQKQINSHRWALQAFGGILQPNLCVFIDVGTEPEGTSIYHLWKNFDLHPSCGSVSGVTKVLIDRKSNSLINPLIASQNFEYKLWNVLDRPFDSIFGLRFSIPGAIFAYRFIALQNDRLGDGPLNEYFAQEKSWEVGVFAANMALTQERALSFALIVKRNSRWDSRYEHAASTTTDVPNTASEYVRQRRRWLNGTFFGSIYAITHIHFIFRSSHSAWRKMLLLLQCLYQSIALLYSWFSIGNLFLIFHAFIKVLANTTLSAGRAAAFVNVLDLVYAGSLFLSFVFSLGHGPRDTGFLSLLTTMWSTLMLLFICFVSLVGVAATGVIFQSAASHLPTAFNQLFWAVIAPLSFIYGPWIVLALASGSPGFVFDSVIQYMILLPIRANIVNVYAFCNIHDISWGIKVSDIPEKLPSVRATPGVYNLDIPSDDPDDILDNMYESATRLLKTKDQEQDQRASSPYDRIITDNTRLRTIVMAPWVLSNGLLIFTVLNFIGASSDIERSIYFAGYVLWSFAAFTSIKSAGALYYFISQGNNNEARELILSKKKN